MKIAQFFVVIWLSSIGFSAQAASFDCKKAQTVTEHTVCDHRQLNDADVKGDNLYHY